MLITDVFYTLSQAAAQLGVERHTLARWIRAGRLDAQRAGGVELHPPLGVDED